LTWLSRWGAPASRDWGSSIRRALLALVLLYTLPALGSAADVIMLDPGHGGADPGAIGALGSIPAEGLPARTLADGITPAAWEKDITLDVAQRTAALLRGRGWQVHLTRTTDAGARDLPFAGTAADLTSRMNYAREVGAGALVSIHANAARSPLATGSETYHFTGADPALASAIQARLPGALGLADRGVRRAGFYVLRTATMPAALVEGGFVTNPADLAALAAGAGRQRWAAAIADGVIAWRQGTPLTQSAAEADRQWWVRATVVRSRAQALRWARQLRQAGLGAWVRPAQVGGAPAWMVSLGRFDDERAAQRAARTAGRLGLRPKVRTVATAPTAELPRAPGGPQPPPPA